jgi:hypothetical protein
MKGSALKKTQTLKPGYIFEINAPEHRIIAQRTT